MEKEPLVSVAMITAAVAAVIALVTAFGLNLSRDQSESILGVVAVLAPLIVGATARGYVTPWSTVVERKVDGLIVAGPANAVPPEA